MRGVMVAGAIVASGLTAGYIALVVALRRRIHRPEPACLRATVDAAARRIPRE